MFLQAVLARIFIEIGRQSLLIHLLIFCVMFSQLYNDLYRFRFIISMNDRKLYFPTNILQLPLKCFHLNQKDRENSTMRDGNLVKITRNILRAKSLQ